LDREKKTHRGEGERIDVGVGKGKSRGAIKGVKKKKKKKTNKAEKKRLKRSAVPGCFPGKGGKKKLLGEAGWGRERIITGKRTPIWGEEKGKE